MPDLELASGETTNTTCRCSHVYAEPMRNPHRIWRWTLRLALPLLVAVTGLVLYWIWFDSSDGGIGWPAIVTGVPLLFVAAAATLWTVIAWCSKDTV